MICHNIQGNGILLDFVQEDRNTVINTVRPCLTTCQDRHSGAGRNPVNKPSFYYKEAVLDWISILWSVTARPPAYSMQSLPRHAVSRGAGYVPLLGLRRNDGTSYFSPLRRNPKECVCPDITI